MSSSRAYPDDYSQKWFPVWVGMYDRGLDGLMHRYVTGQNRPLLQIHANGIAIAKEPFLPNKSSFLSQFNCAMDQTEQPKFTIQPQEVPDLPGQAPKPPPASVKGEHSFSFSFSDGSGVKSSIPIRDASWTWGLASVEELERVKEERLDALDKYADLMHEHAALLEQTVKKERDIRPSLSSFISRGHHFAEIFRILDDHLTEWEHASRNLGSTDTTVHAFVKELKEKWEEAGYVGWKTYPK